MAATLYLSLIFLLLYLAGLAIHRWMFWRDKKHMQQESREGGRIVARVGELK
ncbi:MAG: Rieske 2Fe-2S protein, partial [Deltaproteobacteria bacterium]|nr:Rieske 2Fe-2S protein [Deltaproteobacteria bacterium]